MSEIVNEMIVAVRGDMSKPLNAVDRLRLYEAGVAELEPGDADQLIEYLEEAAAEIERLRSEHDAWRDAAIEQQQKLKRSEAERQRQAEVMEEVRKEASRRALGEAAAYHDDLAAQHDAVEYESDHHERMVKEHRRFAADIRALLSRLEER